MKLFEISFLWITLAPSVYGLMYALGFLYGVWALKRTWKYTIKQREGLFFCLFLGVILWGRLWYVLFYNVSHFIVHPLEVFMLWNGGMSFHGWLIWVTLATVFFARKNKIPILQLGDHLAMIAPFGLFFGRIWNYLNKELLGFPYEGPLAVQTSQWSFFPSPLVEAATEWFIIFIILNFILKKPAFQGQFIALFLILYWVFRSVIETWIRTPDPEVWYIFWFLTQWSILSLPMIIAGGALYYYFRKNHATS